MLLTTKTIEGPTHLNKFAAKYRPTHIVGMTTLFISMSVQSIYANENIVVNLPQPSIPKCATIKCALEFRKRLFQRKQETLESIKTVSIKDITSTLGEQEGIYYDILYLLDEWMHNAGFSMRFPEVGEFSLESMKQMGVLVYYVEGGKEYLVTDHWTPGNGITIYDVQDKVLLGMTSTNLMGPVNRIISNE